jgi:UDP-N-acetylglucosamine 1-carboxyvinyltransferase
MICYLRIDYADTLKGIFTSMSIRQPVRYHVRGGQRLEGTVIIQGAKNAALPIIAASLLAKRGQTILHNVPLINDVYVAIEIARSLGAQIKLHEEEQVLVIDASQITSSNLPSELTNLIRGSVLFLPPVMMRTGKVTIETVGGCNLGKRSLDFHYRGFARLGAQITEDEQTISVRMDKPQGAYLYLDTPSHTGTENLIAAACLAEGTTIIENAALEPEIAHVATFLNLMGAKSLALGPASFRSRVSESYVPSSIPSCRIASTQAQWQCWQPQRKEMWL